MKSTLCQLAAAFALLSSCEAGLPQYEVINLTSWFASDAAPYPNDIQAIGLTNQGEVLTTRSLRTDQGLRLWKNGSPVTSGYVPVLPGYDAPFSGNFVSRYGVGSNGLKAIDVTKADPSDPNNYLKAEYHVVIADTRGLTIQTVPDLPVGNADFSFPNQSPNAKFLTASSNDDTRTWRFDTVTSQWSEIVTGGRWITSNAVNDHGTVVGEIAVPGGSYKPFVYSDGAGLVEIMDGANNLSGEAVAINNNGLVTGTANGRAFVFNSATLEFEFITPAVGLVASDINDAGAIIGATQLGGSIFGIPSDSAFYWDAENGLTGIDNLIGDGVNDWFIVDSTDINENGWILGAAFNRHDLKTYQILLRPVPEPGVAALLMLGSFGFMTRRRRVQRIFPNYRSSLWGARDSGDGKELSVGYGSTAPAVDHGGGGVRFGWGDQPVPAAGHWHQIVFTSYNPSPEEPNFGLRVMELYVDGVKCLARSEFAPETAAATAEGVPYQMLIGAFNEITGTPGASTDGMAIAKILILDNKLTPNEVRIHFNEEAAGRFKGLLKKQITRKSKSPGNL